MHYTLIDGLSTAKTIREELALETNEIFNETGQAPGLALLLVGNNPASEIYVNNKAKACREIGINSIILRLPSETTQDQILLQIHLWNEDTSIHGILVQLPLPSHIDSNTILEQISANKDVDGFHPSNVGKLVLGLPGFVPCTPLGIIELMKRYQIDPSGKHIVVLGRSNIVGKPMANLLYHKRAYSNAIVTICHTGAKDIRDYTRQADILIAAVGVPKLVTSDYVRDGVAIFDVGINRIDAPETKNGYALCGDVDFQSVLPKCTAITPVPKGVGPMTIAMLLSNTVRSARSFLLSK